MAVFQCDCSISHPHKQGVRLRIALHPRSYLWLSVTSILAVIQVYEWYLIMVLVCIPLMTNNEHLFTCVWSISISLFFGEVSIQVFCSFCTLDPWIFKKLLLICQNSLYIMDCGFKCFVRYGYYAYFPQGFGLPLIFLMVFLRERNWSLAF